MNKPFIDTSIFQGVYQFFDNSGDEWRLQKRDGSHWEIYRLKGTCFLHEDTIKCRLKDAAEVLKFYLGMGLGVGPDFYYHDLESDMERDDE